MPKLLKKSSADIRKGYLRGGQSVFCLNQASSTKAKI